MRAISMGGVPAHKQQERAELAAMMAQFEGGAVKGVAIAAETLRHDSLPALIGPHSAVVSDERSVVTELRAIRAEAKRLLARLPDLGQAVIE